MIKCIFLLKIYLSLIYNVLEIIIFKIAIIVFKKLVTDSQQILLFPITSAFFAPKAHMILLYEIILLTIHT